MPDIYVVGTGQRFPSHLTLEVMEVLEECLTIFTLLRDEDLMRLPSNISAKAKSVWNMYHPDRKRSENYAAVSELILAAAKETSPIAWLTWGNPRILDSVSEHLVTMGPQAGLEVTALPAVSSIDSVLVDVGYDPADGLQVLEATMLVARRITIVPEIAALIFQPGVFGTWYPRCTADAAPIDLTVFRDCLGKYYSDEQPLAFVSSSPDRGILAKVTWTIVASLQETAPTTLRNSSIFIPPAVAGDIDQAFIATVDRSN